MNFAHFLIYPDARKVDGLVIFDVDGVLADASHRSPMLSETPTDWDAFFAACIDDLPIVENVERLNRLAEKHHVVLLTSRPVAVQPETVEWMSRHGVRWDTLVMRSAREDISSAMYKREVVKHFIDTQKQIVLAFDDDIRNVNEFVALGIDATYVNSGYYRSPEGESVEDRSSGEQHEGGDSSEPQ